MIKNVLNLFLKIGTGLSVDKQTIYESRWRSDVIKEKCVRGASEDERVGFGLLGQTFF